MALAVLRSPSSRYSRVSPSQTASATTDSPEAQARTFSVPLFLSTTNESSARPNRHFESRFWPRSTRSRTSIRSVIEGAVPWTSPVQRLSVPGLNRTQAIHSIRSMSAEPPAVYPPRSQGASLDELVSEQDRPSAGLSSWRFRERATLSKRAFRRRRVRVKARMSIAFGITLVTALVICAPGHVPFGSRPLIDGRSRSCSHRDGEEYHVPRAVHYLHLNTGRCLLPLGHSNVYARLATKGPTQETCAPGRASATTASKSC